MKTVYAYVIVNPALGVCTVQESILICQDIYNFDTLLMLYACPCVSAGSHSLMALATYIVGQTQFPEFSVVLMLDDVQLLYYDSTEWKVVSRSHRDSQYYDEEQRDAGAVFDDMYNSMRDRAFFHNNHLNHTDGPNGESYSLHIYKTCSFHVFIIS